MSLCDTWTSQNEAYCGQRRFVRSAIRTSSLMDMAGLNQPTSSLCVESVFLKSYLIL